LAFVRPALPRGGGKRKRMENCQAVFWVHLQLEPTGGGTCRPSQSMRLARGREKKKRRRKEERGKENLRTCYLTEVDSRIDGSGACSATCRGRRGGKGKKKKKKGDLPPIPTADKTLPTASALSFQATCPPAKKRKRETRVKLTAITINSVEGPTA